MKHNDLWKPPENMVSKIYNSAGKLRKKKSKKVKTKKVKHAEEARKFLRNHFGLQKFATNHAICFVACKALEWEMPGNKNQYRKTIKRAAKILKGTLRPKKVGKSRFLTSEDFYNSKAWKELRYIALTNCGGTCQLCGAMAKDGVKIHVDHIKPRSRFPGLELDLDNLQVFCDDCNIGKSNYDDTNWKQHWESI